MCRFNGRCRCVPIERDAYLDLLFGSQGTAGFVRISPLFSYDALAVVISRFVCVVDTGPASEGFGCHICWRRSGCKRRVGPCVHLCAVTDDFARKKKTRDSVAGWSSKCRRTALPVTQAAANTQFWVRKQRIDADLWASAAAGSQASGQTRRSRSYCTQNFKIASARKICSCWGTAVKILARIHTHTAHATEVAFRTTPPGICNCHQIAEGCWVSFSSSFLGMQDTLPQRALRPSKRLLLKSTPKKAPLRLHARNPRSR